MMYLCAWHADASASASGELQELRQIPQTSPLPPDWGGDASQAVHPRESDLIRKDRRVPLSLYIPQGRRSDGNSYKTILVYYFFNMFRDE